MNQVIVTGATGMLGASMIEQMVADGIKVTAVIRPNSKKRINLIDHENIQVVECDIDELLTLKSVLTGTYDTFYHFAWDGTYGDSRNDAMLRKKMYAIR